ncbi:glycosyltransferase family 1 protein [Pseudarthrobacter sp. IC2-21]|uniref:rhamnosyltransferase WsaF family glycosyltransferase n=1 Tax=Pseudarthrobacter sp. IC2-21 TaxID=3092262 RepID=UPI002A6A047A|nr:glycosyltransferase family 1 protein [Pseudarthrobacter sp. IC2-21]
MTMIGNRAGALWRTIITRGPSGVTTAVARRLVGKINGYVDLAAAELPVRPEDLADSSTLSQLTPSSTSSRKLQIGWVCAPPSAGSGGHTTLFRMVEEAEQRGHNCTLFLYDKNSDDVSRHEAVIRQHWKNLKATICSATSGMAGMDAIVSSSWGAAHVVASRAPATANRFYFIQDFEPYFYPRGALYAFAEDTYRFGFTNIALGNMIAARLRAEIKIDPDVVVPFGCDDVQYTLLPRNSEDAPRSGVVFYAKRMVDRRGYLLARLALEKFHKQHPEHEIHVVGDRVSNWSIPITNHGSVTSTDLNVLYNRTIASLVLSFTNISLIPEEVMAAGNVPVVNDHEFSRAVLSSPHVIWAKPTPDAIARALSAAVTAPDIEGRASLLGARGARGWTATAALVTDTIESVCANRAASPPEDRVLEAQQ